MATTPRKTTKKRNGKAKAAAKTPRERMAARRKRLRAQGLRPVQFWVPDLRDPKVRADLRRQGRLLARHPENDEIDAWIEQVYDGSEWR
jgi:Antitoxin MazE-like